MGGTNAWMYFYTRSGAPPPGQVGSPLNWTTCMEGHSKAVFNCYVHKGRLLERIMKCTRMSPVTTRGEESNVLRAEFNNLRTPYASLFERSISDVDELWVPTVNIYSW